MLNKFTNELEFCLPSEEGKKSITIRKMPLWGNFAILEATNKTLKSSYFEWPTERQIDKMSPGVSCKSLEFKDHAGYISAARVTLSNDYDSNMFEKRGAAGQSYY